jgi:hypothetical protein
MTEISSKVTAVSQIELACKQRFGLSIKVESIVIDGMPTSRNSHTSIFKADRHTMYALCTSDEPLVLADIKSIVRSIGMKAEAYLPPNADENYFLRFGQKMFQSVFPGRTAKTDQDTAFYQTLAPYSPALIRIAKIDGEIRQYDNIWQKWQMALRFSYQRMLVK